MQLHKTMNTLLLALVMVNQNSFLEAKNNELEEVGRGIAVAGLVGACVGGLVLAANKISSWFAVSNATIIQNAQNQLSKSNTYEFFLLETKKAYHIQNLWLADSSWIKNELNEPLLYNLARTIWEKNQYQDSFFSNLRYHIDNLSVTRNQLYDRITNSTDSSNFDYQIRKEIETMRSLFSQIEGWEIELKALYSFLNYHRSFFNLAENEWIIYRDYKPEIEAFEQYSYNSYTLAQQLTRIVQQKYPNNRYPSIAYTHKLESDIAKIRAARKEAKEYYKERFAWTDKCIDTLKQLRSMIDSWYEQERFSNEQEHKADAHIRVIQENTNELKRLNTIQNQAIRNRTFTTYNDNSATDDIEVKISWQL